MASESLGAFVRAVEEVAELQRADPTPRGGTPAEPGVTRAVGRASVVLLTSHFERYIYAVNEEATSAVNAQSAAGLRLPEKLRLVHSARPIEEMVETEWTRRAPKLRDFIKTDGWLWGGAEAGALDHKRLLTWMKTPTPENLVRYYRHWEIADIFSSITRAVHTKRELRLKLQELVDKRNNIAHGDLNTEATRGDVRGYREAALRFCVRSDGQLARALSKMLACTAPW